MSAASDYLENKVMDHVLGGTPYTAPGTLYLGLFTADTGLESNSPTSEVSGAAYAREAVAFTVTDDTAENSATVTFDAAGAGGWGTITHIAIMDASTSGNVLFHGAVTTSKTIDEGDSFQIASGALTVTLA
jgi:hypothetical protein